MSALGGRLLSRLRRKILLFRVMKSSSKLPDWRHILNGRTLPIGKAGGYLYADQPYIVEADDGAWVCVATTGKAHEGESGQHVVSLRSTDGGITWSNPLAVEPPDGPEASYAVLLKAKTGRLFVFYNHNTDNMREVKCAIPLDPKDGEFGVGDRCKRVDSLGYFVFKYSDDHGRTWSEKRYPINVREFEIDRENVYGGKTRFFWNVGKAFADEGVAYVPLIKVGGFGPGFFVRNEGCLLASDNLLTETNPEKISFETLPEGEVGIRAPAGGGPIASEQSYSVMSDGSFFVVYRTTDGHPACAYSRDKGRTWSEPRYMAYGNGRLIKHPRAANFAWKHSSGYYLYWFNNHGGRDYEDRNPTWLCAGTETETATGRTIHWSQPEIVLYSDIVHQRMSYPDMIERDGKTYLTETEKEYARLHEINPEFLRKLLAQFDSNGGNLAPEDTALRIETLTNSVYPAPEFSNLSTVVRGWQALTTNEGCSGASFAFWIRPEESMEGTLCHNLDDKGRGFKIELIDDGRVRVGIADTQCQSTWQSDKGLLKAEEWNHVVITIDGGPKIISFVINGEFNDGGKERQFGFGRIHPALNSINTAETITFSDSPLDRLRNFRVYTRALLTCESVGLYESGL